MRGDARVLGGVAVTALLALASACGGDARPAARAAAPATPDLPAKVSTVGTITAPAIKPVWLLRSTGTDEAASYDARSQGLFVDGEVAVYWAQDTVIGVSTKDGKELWRSPEDLEGEVVEAGAPHATKAHEWTYYHPATDLGSGDRLVTVDTRSGEVVASREIEGAGTTTRIVMSGGEPYVATREGVYRVVKGGEPTLVAPATAFGDPDRLSLVELAPVPGSDVVVASLRRDYVNAEVIAGVQVPSGKVLWKKELSSYPAKGRTNRADPSRFDGRWVVTDESRPSPDGGVAEYRRLVTLDPRTGRTVASAGHVQQWRDAEDRNHLLSISEDDTYSSGSLSSVLAVPGSKDLLFEDSDGISRFDARTGQLVWTSDTESSRLPSGQDPEWTLGQLSPDGRLVYATLTSGVSGNVVAIDVETGKVRGRWAMPSDYASGLLQKPLLEVVGDQLLLGRNQARDGSLSGEEFNDETGEFEDYTEKPEGALNDLGWFGFPQR